MATEIIAKSLRNQLPVELETITLCNGSVHIELAQLTLSQKLMRSQLLGKHFVKTISEPFFKKRFFFNFKIYHLFAYDFKNL